MIEFDQFGWNVLTLSFLATIFFSLWGLVGLWDQVRKIFKKRSGEAVSGMWFICAAALFGAELVYGFSINSAALIILALCRFPLHIPILIGLAIYKGFTRFEWFVLIAMSVVLVVMLFVPFKGSIFLVISMGVLIPTAAQPYEVWRLKSVGTLSIHLIVVYLTSSVFWAIYSFTAGDVFLVAFFLLSIIIFSCTVGLWFKYREV